MSSTPRFFSPPGAWGDGEVTLPAGESRHALRVLRMKAGDSVSVLDGFGRMARCSVANVIGDRLVATIREVDRQPRPRPALGVYQGAAKGAKLDDVVERLGELGAAEFWAYGSARSVVRWSPDKLDRMIERWRARARSAAKLSGSAWVMEVGGVLGWRELTSKLSGEESALILWEEASEPLRARLPSDPERLALVVGPEGGLDHGEVEELAAAGASPVSLGPRILRTENAAAVAGAAVAWHYGLIG
ncbi:MAG: 16S rRNA (uracil(1498)-N(3))-methyltransferase [Actinomycetota bacterium]|nr:16S rRNA (uracil(1498)-N(3))-methyltransferase [Actinomycetota bacterium]